MTHVILGFCRVCFTAVLLPDILRIWYFVANQNSEGVFTGNAVQKFVQLILNRSLGQMLLGFCGDGGLSASAHSAAAQSILDHVKSKPPSMESKGNYLPYCVISCLRRIRAICENFSSPFFPALWIRRFHLPFGIYSGTKALPCRVARCMLESHAGLGWLTPPARGPMVCCSSVVDSPLGYFSLIASSRAQFASSHHHALGSHEHAILAGLCRLLRLPFPDCGRSGGSRRS